ncbi:hypothetical protein SAMN06264855_109127 [Halorubrum vacuolatum]|uniref:Uncharacterized protein n=1 Tax=Halorubrum vacuolatum TaxID=63740 RepID=A0A238WS58_HALVU|nr:hypothetical protein SAMN06264855_109127 [Halorubrum vacuolatum]
MTETPAIGPRSALILAALWGGITIAAYAAVIGSML